MKYGRRTREDSMTAVIPLLLATATLSLAAIVWRRRAAPRRERHIDTALPASALDAAPAATTAATDTQHASSGWGALVHRQYEIRLAGTAHGVASLCRLMQQHLAELAPSALASFEKSEGSERSFRIGDEYEITMLGPWNGRVRVDDVGEDRFTLITLDGHPEAGTITFSAHETSTNGVMRVMIESWARARDGVVQAAYRTFGIGRQVQTEVWITFLQRLGTLAGVEGTPEVRITTEEISQEEQVRARDG